MKYTFKLVNRIKYNKRLYSIYFIIGNWCISILRLFVKPQRNLIVFSSFGGRKFDDSPKVIYDAMLRDKRFENFELIWAFAQPEMFVLEKGRKIRIDTFTYFKILLKARVWITNSSMLRGLNFTGINTFQLNTWHGSAIKKMGDDINLGNTAFKIKEKKTVPYIMLAQGNYDVKIFHQAFHHPIKDFRIVGLPRNDELATPSQERQKTLKKKLGIPIQKKVILYAPTYREYDKDKSGNCIYAPSIHLKKWAQKLSDNYVLLFRAHYEIVNALNIVDDDFVKNVSAYPNLNELILASDILISDYSSIFFDYSITGKPMLCFTYDFDKYQSLRGMYFDIREELDMKDCSANEDDIISSLLNMDTEMRCTVTKRFRDKYVEKYGNATLEVLDIIYQEAICTK